MRKSASSFRAGTAGVSQRLVSITMPPSSIVLPFSRTVMVASDSFVS